MDTACSEEFTHLPLIYRSGVQGLCTETDVALLSLAEGKGTFYNLNTNRLSQAVSLERIMWTGTPTMWHAFDDDEAWGYRFEAEAFSIESHYLRP